VADVSRDRLEAFLAERASRTGALVGAVYEGLLARLRRGEFDERGDA
jgi:hypothetical protein